MNENRLKLDPAEREDEPLHRPTATRGACPPRRIPHPAIVRAPGLLPMLYRFPELADALGVPALFVRDWMRRGLPFRKDARGNIWIEGREAVRWIESHRRSPLKGLLPDGYAYCLGCRARVEMAMPVRVVSGKHLVLSGRCPRCGRKVNRGSRNGTPRELPSGQVIL
jgi:hypothetical protein